jgi:hypothetical protein
VRVPIFVRAISPSCFDWNLPMVRVFSHRK